MLIDISPVTIDTDNGPVTCTEAVMSLAVSSSVALRLVPTHEGVEYPEYARAVVGDDSDTQIAVFLAAVTSDVQSLVDAKGV